MSELNGMSVNNQSSSTGMSMTGNRQVIGLTIQRAVSPTSWSEVMQKPFETVGQNLKVVNGALMVDTATAVEADNTKPVTSGAVHMEIGNIEVLLSNI